MTNPKFFRGRLVRCTDNNVSPDFQLPINTNLLVIDESARSIRVSCDEPTEGYWHDKSRFEPAFKGAKYA